MLICYHKDCSLKTHAVCLAEKLCEETQLIPISGECPMCKKNLLWGELVRRKQKHGTTNVESASQPLLITIPEGSTIEEESSTVEQQPKTVKEQFLSTKEKKRKLKRRIKRPNKKTTPHWSEELHVN